MPITGESKKITEEGTEKDAFQVSFTNGALVQLENLKNHFKQSDLTEAVKLGISFLQQIKERNEEAAKQIKQ
jgi:hypothetical protein